tara:strand:- start:1393 stop:1788 length:396 start_codon:yes stop_codon:yes gene_type:complete
MMSDDDNNIIDLNDHRPKKKGTMFNFNEFWDYVLEEFPENLPERFKDMTADQAYKELGITKPYFITILWGADPKGHNQKPITYAFFSKDERSAFIDGMNAMDGWEKYDAHIHDEPKTFDVTDFDNWRKDDE